MTQPLLGPSSIAAISGASSATAAEAPARAPRTAPRVTAEEAMKVGRHFEQMFLSQMLSPMFSGLDDNGPFGGGHGEQMMRSFQIDAFAQSIVSRGGIGLAQNVAREVLRLQENHNA